MKLVNKNLLFVNATIMTVGKVQEILNEVTQGT